METLIEGDVVFEGDARLGPEQEPEPLERLEARICSGAANLTAAEAAWLLDVAEFDRRRGWEAWGSVSCAAWLSWQVGLDVRAAREKVRVSHVLVEFTALAEAMGAGVLSYSKARALSRVVTSDNVDVLLAVALACTSNQLERLLAGYRRARPADDDDEQAAHAGRSLTVSHEGATTVIVLRVPIEAGATLEAAVEEFRVRDADRSLTQARADALIELAEHAVATRDHPPVDRPRYLATVHLGPDAFGDSSPSPTSATSATAAPSGVDADADADDPGTAAARAAGPPAPPAPDPAVPAAAATVFGLARRQMCCVAVGDDGPQAGWSVPVGTARRMLCDAAIEGIRDDSSDSPLALGRASRQPTRALRRALRIRDGGCRFPGCTHRGWLDAHHIVHWLDLGPTELDNLLLLCRHHHRLVHEDRWTLHGHPAGTIVFRRPDGVAVPACPPPLNGEAEEIARHGRTAQDGRCRWTGEALDLDYAVSVICDHEELQQRRRATTATTTPADPGPQGPPGGAFGCGPQGP